MNSHQLKKTRKTAAQSRAQKVRSLNLNNDSIAAVLTEFTRLLVFDFDFRRKEEEKEEEEI